MGWGTAADVTAARDICWPESDVIAEDTVAALMAAAGEQCENFAAPLPDGDPIPWRLRLAVVMQARALYQSGFAAAGDQIGVDGNVVQVFPMSSTVKRLLRNQKVPVVW